MQPKKSMLSGLNPSASMAGKGAAMSGAADLGMAQQQQQQQLGVQAMQQNSQLRQQQASNAAQGRQNRMQQALGNSQLLNRQALFDTNMRFDYAKLRKGQRMAWKQAALNGLTREL
jgi:hypothetical protein